MFDMTELQEALEALNRDKDDALNNATNARDEAKGAEDAADDAIGAASSAEEYASRASGRAEAAKDAADAAVDECNNIEGKLETIQEEVDALTDYLNDIERNYSDLKEENRKLRMEIKRIHARGVNIDLVSKQFATLAALATKYNNELIAGDGHIESQPIAEPTYEPLNETKETDSE